MKCHYIAVFVAHAISLPPETDVIDVYNDVTGGISAVLTNDPNNLLQNADRGLALGAVLLTGLFGSPNTRNLDAKLEQGVVPVGLRDNRMRMRLPSFFIPVSQRKEGCHDDVVSIPCGRRTPPCRAAV
jgi:hypothetical protein